MFSELVLNVVAFVFVFIFVSVFVKEDAGPTQRQVGTSPTFVIIDPTDPALHLRRVAVEMGSKSTILSSMNVCKTKIKEQKHHEKEGE